MYTECRHILPGGYRCKAAALKGKAFCFYHVSSRRGPNPALAKEGILVLPPVEDAAGVTIAVNQVLRVYGEGLIDRHQAATFFHGLQIAASLVPKASRDQKPGDTVRETFEDPRRGTIGPEDEGCDPEDCAKCQKRFNCPQSHFKEDKITARQRMDRLAYGPNPKD
jgi:hypothetical protein